MSDYAVAHVGDIAELDDGGCPIRPVRHHFGITAFGVNSFTARAAGDRVINEHEENVPDSGEELYLVLQGHAVFEIDGERQDAPAGTFVFVPPWVRRTAFAEEAGTTVVVVGGTPGKPYTAHGWEELLPLLPRFEAGAYDEVIERGREILQGEPRYGLVAYYVACCESLTGRTAEALDHLRQAIEVSDRYREFAKTDSALDAIRDEPGFKELVGG